PSAEDHRAWRMTESNLTSRQPVGRRRPDRPPPPPGGMLGKGMQLLIALGGHPEGASLSRLADELGFPVSTTHRLLQAMVPPGFVQVDDERRTYELGLTVFQLSHRVARVRTLSELALPVLRRVTEV